MFYCLAIQNCFFSNVGTLVANLDKWIIWVYHCIQYISHKMYRPCSCHNFTRHTCSKSWHKKILQLAWKKATNTILAKSCQLLEKKKVRNTIWQDFATCQLLEKKEEARNTILACYLLSRVDVLAICYLPESISIDPTCIMLTCNFHFASC